MSTFRRRRAGVPEHRLDVLRLTRRIGALGTGLTVVTCLALCAIVENAVAPRLSGHGGAAPGPLTPAGELDKAVGSAVTKRLESAARTAYGLPADDAPKPVVRVSGRDKRRTWAFGASALPAPAGSAAVPVAALFVAHRTGRIWSIGLAGTVRFQELLARMPSSVLAGAQRRALTTYAAVRSADAKDAASGLTLPWLAGSTWTFAGVNAGTLDFVRHDGVVRAAGAGRLFRLCAHGLVMIIHSNGLATEYGQIDPKGIADGAYVAKGAKLGQVDTAAPCRAGHAPARLRFAVRDVDGRLPVNGVRLGAWTLHVRNAHAWATCGSQRVDAGDPMTNEAETPPGPDLAQSPAKTPTSPSTSTPAGTHVPSPAAPPSPEVLN